MENDNRKRLEYPDPNPLEWPAHMRRPESLQDMIKRMVRSQLSQAAQDEGYESFEEADDFEIDEMEPDDFQAYEVKDMVPEGPKDASAKEIDSKGPRKPAKASKSKVAPEEPDDLENAPEGV